LKARIPRRKGAGRVHDFVKATLVPNIWETGPGDLTELYYIDDIIGLSALRDRLDVQVLCALGILQSQICLFKT